MLLTPLPRIALGLKTLGVPSWHISTLSGRCVVLGEAPESMGVRVFLNSRPYHSRSRTASHAPDVRISRARQAQAQGGGGCRSGCYLNSAKPKSPATLFEDRDSLAAPRTIATAPLFSPLPVTRFNVCNKHADCARSLQRLHQNGCESLLSLGKPIFQARSLALFSQPHSCRLAERGHPGMSFSLSLGRH